MSEQSKFILMTGSYYSEVFKMAQENNRDMLIQLVLIISSFLQSGMDNNPLKEKCQHISLYHSKIV
jgi:hypothetical protein